MKVITTLGDMAEYILKLTHPMGLVPTMGSLHQGHLELINRSCSENVSTIVSIFVNPLQFLPNEDFDNYPRDLNRDLEILKKANVDTVFIPTVTEFYPSDFSTYVDVEKFSKKLEGKSRPGHFRGVATVVCKLLILCRPDYAYFGQKDAQQVLLIRQMNRDLNLGVSIVTVPTVRDVDGVAFSSRNKYLSNSERKAARVLYQSLLAVQEVKSSSVDDLKNAIFKSLTKEPLIKIDYVSISDPDTLEEISVVNKKCLVSIAVYVGKIRLIDNFLLDNMWR